MVRRALLSWHKPIRALQAPNSETNAWNWIANVNAGLKDFDAKLKSANHYMDNRCDEDPGLCPTDLAQSDLEKLALGIYKGFVYNAGPLNHKVDWYLVPQCVVNGVVQNITKGDCTGGAWSWIPNPNPCLDGTNQCEPTHPENDVVVQVNKVINTQAPCEQ